MSRADLELLTATSLTALPACLPACRLVEALKSTRWERGTGVGGSLSAELRRVSTRCPRRLRQASFALNHAGRLKKLWRMG